MRRLGEVAEVPRDEMCRLGGDGGREDMSIVLVR